ncbi:MAG TPA: hypothetical protein VGM34_01395 [Chlamydiales bacterium]
MLGSIKYYTGYAFVEETIREARADLNKSSALPSALTAKGLRESVSKFIKVSSDFSHHNQVVKSRLEGLRAETEKLTVIARVVCQIAQKILFWWTGVNELQERLAQKASEWSDEFSQGSRAYVGPIADLIKGKSASAPRQNLGICIEKNVKLTLDGMEHSFNVYALCLRQEGWVKLSLSKDGISTDSDPSITFKGRKSNLEISSSSISPSLFAKVSDAIVNEEDLSSLGLGPYVGALAEAVKHWRNSL